MVLQVKSHTAFNDKDLLEHAIKTAGDEWILSKQMGRNWKTVTVWRSREQLPQGARNHILLLLEHVFVNCGCPEEAKSRASPPRKRIREGGGGAAGT